MKGHTLTTKSRPRRKACSRVIALILAICAIAIPTSASADPTPDGYSSVNAITGGSSGSGGPPYGRPDYATPNAILGADGLGAATSVTRSPAGTGDGFDWASAAVGAGSAMALVTLGGAAFLTVRRRAGVSPSSPTS